MHTGPGHLLTVIACLLAQLAAIVLPGGACGMACCTAPVSPAATAAGDDACPCCPGEPAEPRRGSVPACCHACVPTPADITPPPVVAGADAPALVLARVEAPLRAMPEPAIWQVVRDGGPSWDPLMPLRSVRLRV